MCFKSVALITEIFPFEMLFCWLLSQDSKKFKNVQVHMLDSFCLLFAKYGNICISFYLFQFKFVSHEYLNLEPPTNPPHPLTIHATPQGLY